MFEKLKQTKTASKVRTAQKARAVKSHIQNHKAVYVSGVSCLVVGALAGAISSGKMENKQFADAWKILHIQYKSPNVNNLEQTTVLVRRGHPGNIVKCVETGEIFASQQRASEALGISASNLSRHLRGDMPHVKGLTFEGLGEAV